MLHVEEMLVVFSYRKKMWKKQRMAYTYIHTKYGTGCRYVMSMASRAKAQKAKSKSPCQWEGK